MEAFLKKSAIPALVFITGGCVLVIEIVALRLLAPYFGTTIFATSSVITVVLAALSLGYYVGGKLADKNPSEELFFRLIAFAGVAVVVLYGVGMLFLAAFAYKLSIIQGPLVASLLLFFGQNFFLGMLSPFAVKLQTVRLQRLGVGTASGQIFFWSTLGSIAGSLLAGFFLIPHVGTDKILLGVGFLLVIIGLFAGMQLNRWLKVALIAVLLIVSFFVIAKYQILTPGLLYSKDSLYQKITIYDGTYAGREARFLMQDKNTSAAEFLNSPELAYDYTKYYALYQLFNKQPARILSIGAGAYSVPKALLAELPKTHVDVVEIDPALLALDKQYFGVTNDPRLTNITQDGRRFLHDTINRYNFIFSDAYSSFYSVPSHMTTQEFFTLAKSRLANNGIFMANIIGSLGAGKDSFLLSEMHTFQSVFPDSYFFAVRSPDYTKAQNVMFVGCSTACPVDFSDKALTQNKNPIIAGLSEKLIDPQKFNAGKHAILTDNFAPVDYLISKDLGNLY